MHENNMGFEAAFAFASKRRPVIFPNMGFQRQLGEFEKLLHLHRSYSSSNRYIKQNDWTPVNLTAAKSSSSINKLIEQPVSDFAA